jgi:iron complex transport system permease protein
VRRTINASRNNLADRPEGRAVKVTLDLTKLLQDGAITAEEHARLARLGQQDTSLLLINVLIGFGVIAVSVGAVALLPSALTGVILGGLLMATGLVLLLSGRPQWSMLANICILVAALLLGCGIMLLSQGVVRFDSDSGLGGAPWMSLSAACLVVGALFAGTAVVARSSLLAALAVLMLFAALGSVGFYQHASYSLEVQQPLATILLFSAVALGAYFVSRAVSSAWERLAITAARTAVFLANLGFWVGSLWGDDLTWLTVRPGTTISPASFAVAWAVALFGVAIWAARAGRRWVLNLAAVFGGIHFYTQWFEYLGATPVSVLAAGVLVLVFAVILWQLNRRASGQPAGARC